MRRTPRQTATNVCWSELPRCQIWLERYSWSSIIKVHREWTDRPWKKSWRQLLNFYPGSVLLLLVEPVGQETFVEFALTKGGSQAALSTS